MILYKRNAQGEPIFWEITNVNEVTNENSEIKLNNTIKIKYGIVGVGKKVRTEYYTTNRNVLDAIYSAINAKRKDGYRELRELYDNAPEHIPAIADLYCYLQDYLPKNNIRSDGSFIPMLCKTLKDDKPFKKNSYFGQWKINGERCIITATIEKNLFSRINLNYRSREGTDWTDKLDYLDAYIIPILPKKLLEMMIEENVALDGELYIPGYNINEINSFIKNTNVPQHYKLQYWIYDLCIDNMFANERQNILSTSLYNYIPTIHSKEDHLNITDKLVILPNEFVTNFNKAINLRNEYINLGFEGLILRDTTAEYQFGGKRNNSMLKYKKIEDGLFKIVDIVPEGIKRSHLPKFICKNDVNDKLFTCTLNAPQSVQENIFRNKDNYIGSLMLVEYRERSGIDQVPFHAKGIKIK